MSTRLEHSREGYLFRAMISLKEIALKNKKTFLIRSELSLQWIYYMYNHCMYAENKYNDDILPKSK